MFEEESLIAHWRFSTQRHRLADEYAALFMQLFNLHQIRPREIRGCAIACMVPPLRAVFEEMVRHYLGLEPLMVGPGIRTGIRLAVENPREVGADRVANALATCRLLCHFVSCDELIRRARAGRKGRTKNWEI